MTEDQIYEELGIAGDSAEHKQAILENILVTVEGRFAGIIDDVLTDEQAEQLDAMDSLDDVVSWIKDNLPNSADLYEGVLKDHIDEIKEQLA